MLDKFEVQNQVVLTTLAYYHDDPMLPLKFPAPNYMLFDQFILYNYFYFSFNFTYILKFDLFTIPAFQD